jgi:predicted dehydrogenase
MYVRFAEAIRTGKGSEPNFETAVELHRLIDAIKQASDSGREVRFS